MRTLTYDFEPGALDTEAPAEGDVLASVNGRAIYLIHAARKVRSSVHPARWAYTVERIDREGPAGWTRPGDEARWFGLYWKPWGRRRRA